jgi:RimJ/RimL family protein N-acetyltransferase
VETDFRLETERLVLRPTTYEDVPDLLAMFSDAEHMKWYPSTKGLEATRAWVQWTLRSYEEHGFGLWSMELKESGEFAGQCGITMQQVDDEPFPELGWHTKRSLWGQGLAAEAGASCRDLGFESFGFERMVSLIRPENESSARVARKLGLTVWKEIMKSGFRHHAYSITRDAWKAKR